MAATLDFFGWTPDDTPGGVIDTTLPGEWDELEATYCDDPEYRPLRRIIEIAIEHGVKAVVVERRYIDADWRSLHAEFYGSTFQRFPSVCHRLHFFTTPVDPSFSDLDDLQDHYVGYTVLRPLSNSPVGRTMIRRPPSMTKAVAVECTEEVHLFGATLSVSSMPFISQDFQYMRCGHAALWMVLRHAHFQHGLPQRLPKAIHEACTYGYMAGRQIPSSGLTPPQLLAGPTRLGLSMARLNVSHNAGPDDPLALYPSLCRYINSQLPPIVLSPTHAWVVVAWSAESSPGHSGMTLWRHDDLGGPYLRVDDPYAESEERHQGWQAILMPLMPKMYIAAERAEAFGRLWLDTLTNKFIDEAPNIAYAREAGSLTFRTYAVRGTDYKRRASDRGMPQPLARLYRLAHMPRYVWVVEAVDHRLTASGQPDVLGEMIIDATLSEHLRDDSSSLMLGIRVGRNAYTSGPDFRTHVAVKLKSQDPVLSDLYARG